MRSRAITAAFFFLLFSLPASGFCFLACVVDAGRTAIGSLDRKWPARQEPKQRRCVLGVEGRGPHFNVDSKALTLKRKVHEKGEVWG